MTHERKTYSLSECFHYEGITRQYTLREGKELSIHDLIKLAIEENDFDIDYAYFLIFKRLHLIKDIIIQKTENTGFTFDKDQEIEENVYEFEDYYDRWLGFYAYNFNRGLCDIIRIDNLIEEVVKNKHWDVLYYIYYKEKSDLHDFLSREEEEFNEYKKKEKNRTFFII